MNQPLTVGKVIVTPALACALTATITDDKAREVVTTAIRRARSGDPSKLNLIEIRQIIAACMLAESPKMRQAALNAQEGLAEMNELLFKGESK